MPKRRSEEEDAEESTLSGRGEVFRGSQNGRGTYVDEDGMRFEGHFKDGEFHGRGIMFFPDGGFQAGTWLHGDFHGENEYVGEDGERMVGTWRHGDLEGFGKEYDPNGFLVFEGQYLNSRRHGHGTMHLTDGGRIEGDWMGGTLHGNATYWYPDKVSQLTGKWKHGAMHEAFFHGPRLPTDSKLRPRPFREDEATDDCPSSQPLLQDPYEHWLCCVKKSTLCGTDEEGTAEGNSAGEGLFARRDIPANTLVSWYNGVRVPHKEVDRRAWRFNDNTISLDADYAIDIPPEWSAIEVYQASLGHKANHTFTQPNAKYDKCFHPRFGNIMSIRTISDVKAGEEILVDYKYTNQCPKWYLEAKKRFKQETGADTKKQKR